MAKFKKLLSNKKILIGLVAFIILILGYAVGSGSAKANLDEGKVSYEALLSKIEQLESTIKNVESTIEDKENVLDEVEGKVQEANDKLDEEESKLNSKKDEVDEIFSLIDEKEVFSSDIEALQKELDNKSTEVDEISSLIEVKQSELEKIENSIVKKKAEPIDLLSGEYIVGSDVPAGRYQATNVGRGSNFVVYSSGGSLKVNTILGDDWGDGDYVFWAEDGDFIETAAQVKLIPIED
ncbi:hypothetical protein ACFQ3N_12770 [Virgibacillus byunsanensis]|uniref:Uncharacterized protein n=1 Tax=Virgibacillus byunsanensis TaxID=570945 RepID=A0ABW3LMD7_9BACI